MRINIGEVLCPQCTFMKQTGVTPEMMGRPSKPIMYCQAPYPVYCRPAIGLSEHGFPIIGTVIGSGCDLFEAKK